MAHILQGVERHTPALSTGHVTTQHLIQIYYEVHCVGPKAPSPGGDSRPTSPTNLGATRLVLIMGFACGCSAWYPLLQQLETVWDAGPLEVLMTDNRGIGFSSIPSDKSQYSTSVMAQDVLLVMDHLGWSQAHVAGFSMGGMIATKLAAAAPHRVSSLSILSVTGGGMEILPRCWRGWKYALKGLMAKTPHERAIVDLKLHFSKRTLKLLEPSSGRRLRQVLYEEYTSRSTGSQPQAESGFTGQGYAVWSHSVSDSDVKRIKSGAMPVWYIHGRHDVLATPRFAEQLAARFGAPCVYVDGAHMTSRENADEVALLLRTIMTQSSRAHEPQQASKAPSTYLCLA